MKYKLVNIFQITLNLASANATNKSGVALVDTPGRIAVEIVGAGGTGAHGVLPAVLPGLRASPFSSSNGLGGCNI